jgi:signal transduction histidine kinase
VVERGVREAEVWAGRRGIAVEVAAEPRGSTRVRSSRAIRQMVQELVHNAIRHARARVDVTVADEPEAPCIRIQHDGTALDPERLLADKPSSQHPAGLGIGLWLCRELARRVGATLRADATGVAIELPR